MLYHHISAWRPSHFSLAENMEVKMLNRLERVFSIVADNSVAVCKAQISSDLVNLKHDVTQKFLILLCHVVQ